MRRRTAAPMWLAACVLACLGLVGPGAGRAAAEVEPTRVEVPSEYAGPLTAGPEGALWFARAETLGRVGADGKVTELPLPRQLGSPQGITAGPEGSLWITTTREVDRVSTAGALTRFPLPRPVEKPGRIAVDRGGRAWFTLWLGRWSRREERSFGKAYVVRIDADGTMARFPIPGRARQRSEAPAAIVAGPGGDIWFTDPGLNRIGRVTPGGRITEYRVRLGPEALVAGRGGRLWFAGPGGAGTIDVTGKVRELRTGIFEGLEIGSNGAAAVGPEGDLWFIGAATRVLRLTPSGHLTAVRGPGAPAATEIAAGPEGAIWVSIVSSPIKGVTEAPLLRYEPGLPGIEVRPGTATVRGGKITVRLACGGSTSGCAGVLEVGRGRETVAAGPYSVAAEARGSATLALRPSARRLLARNGYLREPVFAPLEGGTGGFTELVLGTPHPPAPRPGRPLVMPLPEGLEAAGIARGPDGDLWLGADLGRFTRVTPDGRVSSVDVPGLDAFPFSLASDSRHRLWFLEEGDLYGGSEIAATVGSLDAAGRLSELSLPSGPALEELAVGANGTVWVSRSDYPHPGEIDRVRPDGGVKRFPVGREPGAVVADPRGGAWFGESGPRIGHITPSGRVRTFAVPGGGFIHGLTFGPGGDVWFTLGFGRRGRDAIGRIGPSGHIVEHELPHGTPETILAGPEGNLWFTTEFPRRIGRMTPRGKVTTWRRGAAAAGSIAVGPEGNLWFAAGDQNTIAVVHP
jgi:virginiamycin B lyase